jgi:tetratricopeptide (TPR) repeat protein
LAVIVGTIFWIWRAYRRGSLSVPWGFSWFAAAHSPHTGILVAVNALILEHWMYLPSVGMFLGASAAVVPRLKRPGVKYLICFLYAGAVIALGVRTFYQNRIWADPITFYSHIIKFSPDVPRVHNNLGMALSDKGRFAEAEHEYMETIRLMSNLPQPYHNLAQLYLTQNKINEAKMFYEKALQQDPKFFYSAFALSEIYRVRGDMEAAEKYREQALSSRGHLAQ